MFPWDLSASIKAHPKKQLLPLHHFMGPHIEPTIWNRFRSVVSVGDVVWNKSVSAITVRIYSPEVEDDVLMGMTGRMAMAAVVPAAVQWGLGGPPRPRWPLGGHTRATAAVDFADGSLGFEIRDSELRRINYSEFSDSTGCANSGDFCANLRVSAKLVFSASPSKWEVNPPLASNNGPPVAVKRHPKQISRVSMFGPNGTIFKILLSYPVTPLSFCRQSKVPFIFGRHASKCKRNIFFSEETPCSWRAGPQHD